MKTKTADSQYGLVDGDSPLIDTGDELVFYGIPPQEVGIDLPEANRPGATQKSLRPQRKDTPDSMDWIQSLSGSQLSAMHVWMTYSGYETIRHTQVASVDGNLSGLQYPERSLPLVYSFESAIETAPEFVGRVYRGILLPASDSMPELNGLETIGSLVTLKASSAATKDPTLAKKSAGDGVFVRIDTQSGRDLSNVGGGSLFQALADDQEVVLSPGSVYRVADVQSMGGNHIIHLVEDEVSESTKSGKTIDYSLPRKDWLRPRNTR